MPGNFIATRHCGQRTRLPVTAERAISPGSLENAAPGAEDPCLGCYSHGDAGTSEGLPFNAYWPAGLQELRNDRYRAAILGSGISAHGRPRPLPSECGISEGSGAQAGASLRGTGPGRFSIPPHSHCEGQLTVAMYILILTAQRRCFGGPPYRIYDLSRRPISNQQKQCEGGKHRRNGRYSVSRCGPASKGKLVSET